MVEDTLSENQEKNSLDGNDEDNKTKVQTSDSAEHPYDINLRIGKSNYPIIGFCELVPMEFKAIELFIYKDTSVIFKFKFNGKNFQIDELGETNAFIPHHEEKGFSFNKTIHNLGCKNLIFFITNNKEATYNNIAELYCKSKFLQVLACYINKKLICGDKDKIEVKQDETNDTFVVLQSQITFNFNKFFLNILSIPKISKFEKTEVFIINKKRDVNESLLADENSSIVNSEIFENLNAEPESYSKTNIAWKVFSNTYQLHFFTYIAYITGLISMDLFTQNAQIGYLTLEDLYKDIYSEYFIKLD